MGKIKKQLELKSEDQIKLMLGYICSGGEDKTLAQKVKVLDRFQLNDGEISVICSCSVPSVANARLQNKKAK